MDEAVAENGQIFWSPTNTAMLRYVPAASGLTPGPMHSLCCHPTLTDEILQHVVATTNLHADWRDVDIEELQA